jgi:MFS family permease
MGANPATRARHAGRAALQHPDFIKMLAARVTNSTATNMLHVVVGWEVYRFTGDPLALGLLGLAQFLPNILFFLLTGFAADRLPRQALLATCFSIQTLAAVALLLIVGAPQPALPAILAVLFVIGTCRAFAQPTGQALIPNLVPSEHLGNAIAWASSGVQLAVIVGPALGGLALVLGSGRALGTVAVVYACAAVTAALIRNRSQQIQKKRVTPDTILAGIRFIWHRKIILGAISLDLFAVLLGGATALLPVYASDILNVGEVGLGALRSSIAVGAALCGVALTQMPISKHVGRTLLITVAAFGVAIIVFGLSKSFWLSVVALFAAGAADMVSMFIRNTLVQLATPDEMRGRVSAVSSMFIGASNELGEFESGGVAALVGVLPSVLIGGVGTVVVALLWSYLFPDLRQVDALDAESLASRV